MLVAILSMHDIQLRLIGNIGIIGDDLGDSEVAGILVVWIVGTAQKDSYKVRSGGVLEEDAV